MTLVLNKDIFSHIDRCDFLNNNFGFYVFCKKCCSVNFLFSKASSNVSSFKCNHLSGLAINNSFPLLSQRASEKGSFPRGHICKFQPFKDWWKCPGREMAPSRQLSGLALSLSEVGEGDWELYKKESSSEPTHSSSEPG